MGVGHVGGTDEVSEIDDEISGPHIMSEKHHETDDDELHEIQICEVVDS